MANIYAGAAASDYARQHNGNIYNQNTAVTYTLRQKKSLSTLSEDKLGEELLRVATEGQTRRLEYLIRTGANIDYADEDRLTAVHHAALSGFEDCVEALLIAGADVNATSPRYGTALCLAALKGRHNVAELLIKAPYRARVGPPGGWLGSSLHAACHGGHLDILQMLLGHCTKVDTLATVQLNTMYQLLEGNWERRKLDVDAFLWECQPLVVAVSEGHSETVKHLLDRSASVDALKRHWRMRTLDNPSFASADKDKQFHGSTALMTACERGHLDVMRILLEKGAVVDRRDGNDCTALMCAAYNNRLDCMTELIQRGASVDLQAKSGTTALMYTATKGQSTCAQTLIENGASLDLRDKYGCTALMVAADRGFTDVVDALVTSGADVSVSNNKNMTALELAAKGGFDDCVTLLTEAGARGLVEHDSDPSEAELFSETSADESNNDASDTEADVSHGRELDSRYATTAAQRAGRIRGTLTGGLHAARVGMSHSHQSPLFDSPNTISTKARIAALAAAGLGGAAGMKLVDDHDVEAEIAREREKAALTELETNVSRRMGLDTRRPPLPAPTETTSSMDHESNLGTELATNVSRRTNKTFYSIPEDGSPITLSGQKLGMSKESGLGHRGWNKSQTSLLIEYFEGGKSGDKTGSRPSVRVKVTPSAARKTKYGNDAIPITGIGKDRKPSYTRRISLGSKKLEEGSLLPEGTKVSEPSESNLSGRPPIEIEVLNHNGSGVSDSKSSRGLMYTQRPDYEGQRQGGTGDKRPSLPNTRMSSPVPMYTANPTTSPGLRSPRDVVREIRAREAKDQEEARVEEERRTPGPPDSRMSRPVPVYMANPATSSALRTPGDVLRDRKSRETKRQDEARVEEETRQFSAGSRAATSGASNARHDEYGFVPRAGFATIPRTHSKENTHEAEKHKEARRQDHRRELVSEPSFAAAAVLLDSRRSERNSGVPSPRSEPFTHKPRKEDTISEGEGHVMSSQRRGRRIKESESENDDTEDVSEMRPVYLKGIFSVSMASSKPLTAIRDDIIRVLRQLHIDFKEIKGGFICKRLNDHSDHDLSFEVLVVKVPLLFHGIQFKKVSGGTWQYNETAQIILNELRL